MNTTKRLRVSLLSHQPSLSAGLVVLLTILAMLLGWLVMSNTMNRTNQVENSGVKAFAPAGWMVKYGLQGEELVFWTGDQLDPNHRYIVSALPIVPGGMLTDVVVGRNFNQGQTLTSYQVVSQLPKKVNQKDGYQVDYAYIKTGSIGEIPIVIRGSDFYIPSGNRVILVTLEDTSESFDGSLNDFFNFLGSIQVTEGG